MYSLLQSFFGNFRKNKKGSTVWNIFKQIFCWLYNGTSRHINYFDQLKGDEGYTQPEQEHKILRNQLKLKLPKQPLPKIPVHYYL